MAKIGKEIPQTEQEGNLGEVDMEEVLQRVSGMTLETDEAMDQLRNLYTDKIHKAEGKGATEFQEKLDSLPGEHASTLEALQRRIEHEKNGIVSIEEKQASLAEAGHSEEASANLTKLFAQQKEAAQKEIELLESGIAKLESRE